MGLSPATTRECPDLRRFTPRAIRAGLNLRVSHAPQRARFVVRDRRPPPCGAGRGEIASSHAPHACAVGARRDCRVGHLELRPGARGTAWLAGGAPAHDAKSDSPRPARRMRISRVTPAIARLHTSLWASQASARGPRGLGRGCLPSPPPSCGPQQSSQLLRPQPQILLPHSASAGGSDPLLQCTVGSDSGVCRCVKILNCCCRRRGPAGGL